MIGRLFTRLKEEPVFRAMTLVVLIWLYIFPYSQALNNPNERTRVMQARALSMGQLHIGHTENQGKDVLDLYGNKYPGPFVNDVALVCHDESETPPGCDGLIYPAKAPGTALIGLPAMGVAEVLGIVSEGRKGERRATWILRVFGVILPMLLCLLAWVSILRRLGLNEELVAKALLVTALGTGVHTYSLMFVGHALAGGVLVAGIWALLRARESERTRHAWAALGGVCTGAAVLFEYHAVVAVLCLGLWVVLDRGNWRTIPGFAVGGLVALAIHALIHIECFGSPLQTGHFYLMTEHNRTFQSSGFLGITGFHLGSLKAHLFDPYMGFFFLMPWVIFGWLAGGWAVLKGAAVQNQRSLRWLLFSVPLLYLVFVSLLYPWDIMNGWSMGPRYLVPATLPLTALIALGWSYIEERSWFSGRVLTGLAAASVVMVSSITAIFPSLSPTLRNPFADVAWPMLGAGFSSPNFGASVGLGSFGIGPYLVLIGLAVFLIVRDVLPEQLSASTGKILKNLRLQTAFLIALVWLVFMATWSPTSSENQHSGRLWVAKATEGPTPSPDCFSLESWCSLRCSSSDSSLLTRRRPPSVEELQSECGIQCPECD